MGSGGKSDLALPLSELEDYGSRLRDIKTRLNHTKKLFESYQDDLGDHTVYDALDDFESGWEDGREDIGQALDALAKMSDAVVREFKKLDDDLAKQVRDGVKQEDPKGGQAGAAK
jgi:ABC-type transporter Mla subunit MlaD